MFNALRVLVTTVLFLSSTVFLWAQSTTPDYAAWQSVATRATEAVDAGRASDTALEDLRSQLVSWRNTFDEARSTNSNAIEIVSAQLDALGPEPEGGEPAEISTQRQSLTASLSVLRAPVQTAEVAYTEADGLIGGVDDILRERQSDALLQRGPIPLNPVYWPDAAEEALGSLIGTWNEINSAWKNPIQFAELKKNAPEVIFLLALAFLLLSRGRRWFVRLAQSIQVQSATLGRWLAASAVSLGQIILPLAGLWALISAVYATGMPGLRGELILSNLMWAGFLFLGSIWLGAQVFPKSMQVDPFIRLPLEQRIAGRLYASILGALLGFEVLLSELARYDTWSDASKAVIYFPIFVLTGVVFWRLAVLLRQHRTEGGDINYGDRLIALMGSVLFGIAIFGISMSAIGYFNGSLKLMIPTITTLQVLAVVLVLQRVVMAVFSLATGDGEGAKDSLIPVLIGVALVVAAMPVLAMVWGARSSDLAEVWLRLTQGVQIGDTQYSPTDFFTFLLIFFAGFTLTRLLQGAMKNSILPKTKMDRGGQNAVVSGLGYVGIFLAALIAINATGLDLSSIALVAGALSVGIGFGLQNVVSNFVSGIILLIERPVSEGDWIEVGGNMGYVRNISVRSTRIETFDRTDVIVPNADLVSGTVTNYTRGNTIGRVIVPVGVAYGTDPRKVEKILLEVANNHPMVVQHPEPSVIFQGFGASSLDFEIRAILRDVNWVLSVKSELNFAIAERFMAEGIEIPFPQTDIWLRNPEALPGHGQKPKDKDQESVE
ncbi:DUF3772 domain-containing protein [Cognatishimia activa]|uniref:DUF3772 domain-containing protein n=1 Tax=Cognatishimia activa TaxID=1715691 RepID=UPI00222FC668|nr:DUF3772 domain-containing protein [Cognatishimia activa]UZD92085.1 DUF3772 domain-containing protein [Cognatishimia activa]